MAITPYEAYSLYSSIRLHFTADSYDAIKYHFKTRSKQSNEKFLQRKDKYFFAKLSKKFNNSNHLCEFLACNFMYRDPRWIGNLLEEDADKAYGRYLMTIEGLTGHLEHDIMFLRDQMLIRGWTSPKNLFTAIEPDTDFPVIYNLYQKGEIKVESLIALDSVLNFLTFINNTTRDDNLIWTNQYKKLKKYQSFIMRHIDISKVKELLRMVFYKELKNLGKTEHKEQTG